MGEVYRAGDPKLGRDLPPYAFALSYNGLGETDEAIAWLVRDWNSKT